MTRSVRLAWAIVGVFCAGSSAQESRQDAVTPRVTAFVNVNVIPMDRERVLPRQTVIVADGRITHLGPTAETQVPRDALRIDGTGQYLIPGLADMHVHMFDVDEMSLYLANGITTVRNLHGIRQHLQWREQISKGEILGPRLFTSGPILDGDPPTRGTNRVLKSPTEAEQVVADQKRAGYDFIKLYDNVPRDIYAAILAAAGQHKLPVVGHLPTPVGLEGLLATRGQKGIEHVEELLPLFDQGRDASKVDAIARALAEAGVWVTPTLDVFVSASEQSTDWPALQKLPEMKYVNPATAKTWGWENAGKERFNSPRARERFPQITSFLEGTLTRALHEAGVRLLAGSDAPMPALVPGFSLMTELRALVRSGLTPYEALTTATRNAAEFLGQLDTFGTVAIGKAADLVLLEANPFESIGHLERRVGVMVKGRWLPHSDLQKSLDELAAKYARLSLGK